MHSRLKRFFKRSERHHAKPLLFNDSDIFQLHSPQKSMDESTPSLPCSMPPLNNLHSPGNRTSSLPPPRQDSSYLKNETSSLPPPQEDSSYLKNETSSLPPPQEDSSYLKNETSSLPPPPQDSSYLKNETSSLPPPQEDGNYIEKLPPEDYQPKNESFTIFPSCHNNLHDEDELSFLNSSIPLLPPPMQSLQVLSRIHLPFQPPAPKACSTPNLTMLSSPPKSFEQDGEKVDLEERGRESHRKPQVGNKQGHKAVRKNARAKEIMSKRRQKKWKVVEKPVIIDVEKYQPPHPPPPPPPLQKKKKKRVKAKKSGSGSLICLKEIDTAESYRITDGQYH